MMQSEIYDRQPLGKPGDLYDATPYRLDVCALSGLTESKEAIGRVFTFADNGPVLGGEGAFAGILLNQNAYAPPTLGASLAIEPGQVGALLDQGRVVVITNEAADAGSAVQYDKATGAIAGNAPSTLQADFALLPNARFLQSAAAGELVVLQIG